MLHDNYMFFGMHLIWWVVWLCFIFWIFFIPYDIPGERRMKDSPLDLLKKRLASGQISIDEYREAKKMLED